MKTWNEELLSEELKRLQQLSLLRVKGVELAVKTINLLEERLDSTTSVRDLNRSAEVVTKVAVTASAQLDTSGTAERERNAPARNVVLIILESNIPDNRKQEMLTHIARELGDGGDQIVHDSVQEIIGEERAEQLLAIEAAK